MYVHFFGKMPLQYQYPCSPPPIVLVRFCVQIDVEAFFNEKTSRKLVLRKITGKITKTVLQKQFLFFFTINTNLYKAKNIYIVLVILTYINVWSENKLNHFL